MLLDHPGTHVAVGIRTMATATHGLRPREAADHALKCRVALIQGPPGTGKTFIGCKLLQMFLPESRVLVLTYKNHVA